MNFKELKGSKEINTPRGTFLSVERYLTDDNNGKIGDYLRKQENWDYLKRSNIRHLSSALEHTFKNNMLFLDIETYGLGKQASISMIALSHLAADSKKDVKTDILVARDPLEEIPMLYHTLEEITKHKSNPGYSLVTYNGKSFDIPKLASRIQTNGLMNNGSSDAKTFLSEGHLDLMYEVKNRMGILGLPDAKLQTVEKLLFEYVRKGDIAGKQIVKILHEYSYGTTMPVEKIDEKGKKIVIKKAIPLTPEEHMKAYGKVKGIIDHNELDNLSMVAIMAKLCEVDSK